MVGRGVEETTSLVDLGVLAAARESALAMIMRRIMMCVYFEMSIETKVLEADMIEVVMVATLL